MTKPVSTFNRSTLSIFQPQCKYHSYFMSLKSGAWRLLIYYLLDVTSFKLLINLPPYFLSLGNFSSFILFSRQIVFVMYLITFLSTLLILPTIFCSIYYRYNAVTLLFLIVTSAYLYQVFIKLIFTII